MDVTSRDLDVVAALAEGLELCACPYRALGERIAMPEAEVIARIGAMVASGIIRRLGIIVRHHELGWRANAMAVWDIPDDHIGDIGRRLAEEEAVTLCYRRPRRLPDWPYSLFCMIHGRDRIEVLATIAALCHRHGLEETPHDVLFSSRRFKQCGARYTIPQAAE
jgi:siroheme decarboxylase